jgi:hypothetical protein
MLEGENYEQCATRLARRAEELLSARRALPDRVAQGAALAATAQVYATLATFTRKTED